MRGRSIGVVLVLLWQVALGQFAGAAAAQTTPPTQPATLNLQIRLDAGVIQIGDLWRNAGTKATTVIGPAPPPGHAIVIEAAQLAYIARLYDVNWQPVSGVERCSVERAGRVLARDEVIEPIRHSLLAAGIPDTMSLELASFTPVLVPPLAFPLVMVEGLSYEPATDHFSANLSISADGMPTQIMRVAGRVVQLASAVVATRRLLPDEVIAAGDVRLVQLPERRLGGDAVSDPALVVGLAARRAIALGQPILSGDIGQPVMIAKGATVVLLMDTPGLSIAAQGLALASGGRDDTIQVMNPLSRAVMAARVIGPGRATITPGSAPLVPPANATQHSPEIAQ